MKIVQENLAELEKMVQMKTRQLNDPKVVASVSEIINNVIENGDQALKDYEKKFDNVDIDNFKLDQKVIDEAYDNLDEDVKNALFLAKKNITSFHKKELEDGFMDSEQKGVLRGQKLVPLEKVGLYVPGGTAAYPSTIMMSALPAKIAGVDQVVIVTPPQKDGINPAVLAAAKIAGVDAIYQVGGAQAIAALAYGTESVPRVDKIVGPGNIFVATAKKQVFGQVAIDMVAGPSEIGIIADDSADPRQLAADLLSQAEHDKLARPILVTDSLKLAKAVSENVDSQLKVLPREEIATASVNNKGFIAVVEKIDDMFTLMNTVAPEHLEIQLEDPTQYLNQIRNAGSVFLGKYASEPLGDYVAGPNHILPTGGTARFSSPLGVYDFVKRTSYIQYTKPALEKEAKSITTLARVEGLEGHARAIESRFGKYYD
ncbi:histidinol dehydrogenase [Companilactobacillus sp.]|jgi:histidinol dehydrogenase|uniref:histidinol dehydrogenase n=1 Tax=Companilactobacillus sp. TaxID=2767905 RepID=UPI0025C684B1|nr:histidinol dehydrogenase [Companilactobacillus sp.]MCH4008865.1 histidinol dehydrogenase [Companilactobacillus sp.]MCH4050956.1 histidinol dehydrogenase [Companilactobacillus sp.]MCH4076808.1 histidinol dehydrogenase [Companilactobacillus sp.]MCH4125383.1 histidinol dehydrogenase [Companilactobacillus sp.]MCH4131925.1 histidinol dehydrogenase [Companilactobacillus sp.]